MSDPFQSALEHHQAGRLAEAERLYRQVLDHDPRNNHALYLLAILARQQGRGEVSLDLVKRAIAINPNVAEYHLHLGKLLMEQHAYAGAAEELYLALKLQPAVSEAEALLGNALYMNRDLEGAIAAFNRFLSAQPNSPEILNNLGTALRETGRPGDAVAAYRKAVALRPDLFDVWQNLGHTLRQSGQPQPAADAYRNATRLKPDSAQTQYDLAAALKEAGDLDAATDAVRTALRLQPGWLAALSLLGGLCHATAQPDEALVVHRQLLENGTDARWAASLLHALHYNPQLGPARIYAEHVRWNQLYARPLAPTVAPACDKPVPGRRLRIGYVSPDFLMHASSLFTLPLLSNHDRSAFEVFCYADIARPDELTAAHRARCDTWRDITRLSDEQAAEMIRSDRIGILVDLSLHTAKNRLMIFARKPAPVQLTWLAYPGTSGLETMDYRVSDPYLDPPGLDEQWYSEKTIRLPDSFWCYDPLHEDPPVAGLAALANGFVTFGSMNGFAKVNPPTIELWAKVLAAVPGSRMVVLAPQGRSRDRFLEQMKSHGVEPARIEFVPMQARGPYLSTFGRIDICLDTAPYTGHTTTLDALWMGVPVLTRPGATAASRGGVSILSNAGHPEWIAHSPDEFVATARALAANLPALAELRRGLRNDLRRSPLMDATSFARNMESIYRSVCGR